MRQDTIVFLINLKCYNVANALWIVRIDALTSSNGGWSPKNIDFMAP